MVETAAHATRSDDASVAGAATNASARRRVARRAERRQERCLVAETADHPREQEADCHETGKRDRGRQDCQAGRDEVESGLDRRLASTRGRVDESFFESGECVNLRRTTAATCPADADGPTSTKIAFPQTPIFSP